MSEIDKDLQRRLKGFAEGISAEPGRTEVIVRSARRKRRLVALSAGLAVVLAIGGLAGAATLLGDRDGTKPAPEPATLTEADLASMTVDELAAALFKDEGLADAVPTEAGFSLRKVIRHGPERTNHDYATVGVQMDGPVNYSRVIFFVHLNEEAATAMGIRRSELLSRDWKMQRDEEEDVKAFGVSNAPPGAQCGIVYGQLLSCHAVLGRVLVLTQSGDEGPSTPQVTDEELEAAKSLIRSFGSYLERVYPEHEEGSVARYFFEAASRDASASGVLEVNSQEATLCYQATTNNIRASHLLRNTAVVAGGRRFERNIVVTFFDPDDREQGAELPSGAAICFQEEQLSELEGGLQVLIDHPEDFRVDFHRGPNDEPGLVAELTSSPDAERAETECLSQDDDSYGATAIGKWLAQVLNRLGAPKQAHITSADIVDTGTALGLSADLYGSRLWAYITAQRPPDDGFPPEGAEIVGDHRGSVLYYWQDRTIKSFTAHSPQWQLSVLVYPAAGEQEVPWTRGDSQIWSWFRRVLDYAAENPPPCS